MLDYLRDVAIISAWRKDRDEYENSRLMLSLEEDLFRNGYTPQYCESMLGGRPHDVYIVQICSEPQELKTLFDLARKYGQDTMIYAGCLYDVSSGCGRKLYTCATIYAHKPYKWKKMNWVHIERGYYLVLS